MRKNALGSSDFEMSSRYAQVLRFQFFMKSLHLTQVKGSFYQARACLSSTLKSQVNGAHFTSTLYISWQLYELYNLKEKPEFSDPLCCTWQFLNPCQQLRRVPSSLTYHNDKGQMFVARPPVAQLGWLARLFPSIFCKLNSMVLHQFSEFTKA